MALLEVHNLSHSFGGLRTLDGVSFEVQEGQIKAVIGPNGAGKTTLFNVISGFIRPQTGEIRFAGTRITGLQPHQVGRLGMSRTFQNLCLFTNMTVLENVMIGRHCRSRCGMLGAALRLPGQRAEERAIRERAMEFLQLMRLDGRANELVGGLSFGQRRLVELARALATEPRLLLLDEPASGLNTRESDELAKLIVDLRGRGVTILLVEHDMSLVMEITDAIFVLNLGKPVTDGPPAQVRQDPRVISVYLGGGPDNAAD